MRWEKKAGASYKADGDVRDSGICPEWWVCGELPVSWSCSLDVLSQGKGKGKCQCQMHTATRKTDVGSGTIGEQGRRKEERDDDDGKMQ